MENRELEMQLEKDVQLFINQNFNFIQLEVYEREAQHNGLELMELIEQEEPDLQEFLNDYMLHDDLEKYCKENDLEKEEKESILEFCEVDDFSHNLETWKDEQQDNNYPMWNTLFEFRSEPPSEWIEKAQKVGLGVINEFGTFNTTLFASSAGHSFNSAYWIPLYLSIFEDTLATQYKGIKYDHL